MARRRREPAGVLLGLTEAELTWLERHLRAELHLADPVAWVRERLGEHLWSAQREIAYAVRDHRRVAVRSAQDVGKSRIASRLACWWIDTHPVGEAFVVTTAPTFKQVQAVLWREMRSAHAAATLPGVMSETEWKIGGRLVAFGRKPADYDPDAFQGIHTRYVLVIMDEACGIPESLWTAAETLMANEGSRILAIGNPDDPMSSFATACAPGSGWHSIRIDGYASPNFTDEPVPSELRELLLSRTWVAERKRSWGEDSPLFISKVRGEFPEDAEDALIPLTWIRAAQARFDPEPAEPSDEPTILGVDIARYGSDETVIVARHGDRAWIVARYRHQDTMATTGRVVRAIQDLGAREALVDVIGIGSGVVDRLAEQHQPVTGLNAGAAARSKRKFANARAEWCWGVRDRMEKGQIAIQPDDELAAQLAALRYTFDSSGRIQIESKEDMRSRGIASPDIADALMLAFSARETPSFNITIPNMWRASYWRGESDW
ncbi:MAG: hypothetical protein M3P14_01525 [Chloroflexota bacterium]|nr:hypothetical protein [Chloroflexota bacterium]